MTEKPRNAPYTLSLTLTAGCQLSYTV